MKFITEKELNALVEVIKEAESKSTGEIRVHIDSNTQKNFDKVAFSVFKKLKMDKTKERNAVLFYVHFDKKHLSIIGDKGIHEKVKQNFWDGLYQEITQGFTHGEYFTALKKGILKTGVELKKYFPINGENPNELPNEISFS